ncbi:MAG TPA: NnrS family protein [Casimicrobiaceae bacterium]
MNLHASTVPAEPRPAACAALWRLGFRPFYLLASLFAAISIALWAVQYAGWLPRAYLAGPVWHAHEMLFGFTLAVIAGFLLTAVRNWTGRPTPTGVWLAAIAALWVAGRIFVLTPYAALAVALNVAFPLAVAVAIGIPLVRSANRRNYFFLALLVALAAAVLVADLAQLGVVALPAWLGLRIALDLVLFIMAVMSGRVIPMFTNNGVPGTQARRHPLLEKATLGGILVLLAADVFQTQGAALAGLLALLAAVNLARLWLWQPWRTLRVPLVWILHAAYLWIPIHLALRALGEAGVIASALATHALTVGAIGGLTMGMMTRTAKGHTGVALQAGRSDVACYVLVLGAAVVRVLGPMLAPSQYVASVLASAALWSAAYALYAVRYAPLLTRPRQDGRPG